MSIKNEHCLENGKKCQWGICDSAPWPADPRDESATLTQGQGYLSTTEATTHGSSVRDEKVTNDQDETRSHPGIGVRERVCEREGISVELSMRRTREVEAQRQRRLCGERSCDALALLLRRRSRAPRLKPPGAPLILTSLHLQSNASSVFSS